MNIDSIVSLISSVGFPIVCCVMLWQYINTTVKDLTQTIAENTKVISLLLDRFERDGGGENNE